MSEQRSVARQQILADGAGWLLLRVRRIERQFGIAVIAVDIVTELHNAILRRPCGDVDEVDRDFG